MPGDHSLWASEEFLKRRNWIDFGRGLAGGYAVIVALAPLVLTEWRPPFGQPLIWVAAPVLVVGVLMQTLRWEGRITLFPPIFYVLGLAFPLIGGTAAFLAFVAIWAINLVLPSAGVFLFTYAGIGLILGLLMGAGVAPSALLALVALLPPFVAVMSKRRLVQFSKKTKVIIR